MASERRSTQSILDGLMALARMRGLSCGPRVRWTRNDENSLQEALLTGECVNESMGLSSSGNFDLSSWTPCVPIRGFH